MHTVMQKLKALLEDMKRDVEMYLMTKRLSRWYR